MVSKARGLLLPLLVLPDGAGGELAGVVVSPPLTEPAVDSDLLLAPVEVAVPGRLPALLFGLSDFSSFSSRSENDMKDESRCAAL